uniref:Ribose/xylose/arabinose/galactoside ABC-type transport system, permease component n=1 Tax=Candidatus Kentrum sp. FM TaxID=2126340 RepID=A0A450SH06_9GAMM|nr:MAG: Ribose/xylose/arabinose/galactoside ABC-type transport system, permease component [Candidatus Kentron sp. FM]VFJ52419.1 MAG: Ribose/xylose/arabinose/galactoside ABC-type transport system, permease component [Candidatus Kentron sp. FM]VFK07704.1 MAG: Ribose/xylose/arabinose/galactoside ABC-type transport system, permease component [Candidatus Kentron sp. FM]
MKIRKKDLGQVSDSVPEVGQKVGLLSGIRGEIPRGQGLLVVVLGIASLLFFAYLIYRSNGGFQITLANFMKEAVPLLLLAWGAGLVLATGRVDISLAGIATLSGVLFAALSYTFLYLGIVVALFVGCIFGLVNGWLVSRRDAPSLLVTWAVGVLTSSLAGVAAYLFYENGWPGSISSISVSWNTLEKPFHILGGGYFYLFFGIAVAIGTYLFVSRLGALARVVGANSLSAKYAGFGVERIIFLVYGIAGLGAATAGCLYTTVYGAANSTGMFGMEMIAIAIAVLGGTVMSGGYFSALGILTALTFWTLLDNLIKGESLGVGLQEGRLTVTLIAIIVIVVAWILGPSMSGTTRTIQIDDIER